MFGCITKTMECQITKVATANEPGPLYKLVSEKNVGAMTSLFNLP